MVRASFVAFYLFFGRLEAASFQAAKANACDGVEGLFDLTVSVHRAHVKSADLFSASDPYAVVSIGAETQRTDSLPDTNSPAWEEAFTFPCANPDDKLKFAVRDYDLFTADDLLFKAEWIDWAPVAPETQKLYNNGNNASKYWLLASVNTSDPILHVCPSTCGGSFTCDEIDDEYGLRDGVCDKGGEALVGCDCMGCACNNYEATCASSYTLVMSSTDTTEGWGSTFYSWKTTEGEALSSGTLTEGLHRQVELCTKTQAFDCYTLQVGDEGAEASSTISWKILDDDGKTKGSGGAPGMATVCRDELCDETLVTIRKEAASGDGWGGNVLEIQNCNGKVLASGITLGRGQSAENATLCVDKKINGAYWLTVVGGPSEGISWSMWHGQKKVLSGGSPYFDGTCNNAPSVEDDGAVLSSCIASCQGHDCDYLDSKWGLLSGTCDYFGAPLYSTCDCSGCECSTGGHNVDTTACYLAFRLDMNDASGDGWAGGGWRWSTKNGVDLSSGLGPSIGSNSQELCVFPNEFGCYILHIDNQGTWPSEQSWSLSSDKGRVVATGGAPDVAHVCTDDLCPGQLFAVTMMDDYGDGWNGNTLAFYDCSGALLEELTLVQGSKAKEVVCIAEEDNLFVSASGGSFQDEVSWEIARADNDETFLAGGAPFIWSDNCAEPSTDDGHPGTDDAVPIPVSCPQTW